MSTWKRLLLALGVALSGLLLVPYVALPNESFSWRLFVGAYGSVPAMGVNYTVGAPGSFFTVSGYNFPADQPVTIAANDRVLGSVTAAADGSFSVVIATAGAPAGMYLITGDSPGISLEQVSGDAVTRFELREGAPLRALQSPTLPRFDLAPALAEQRLYIPMARR
jgi:hypothetical protein